MTDLEQLERALINADKAGDADAARQLAFEIKRRRTLPKTVVPAGIGGRASPFSVEPPTPSAVKPFADVAAEQGAVRNVLAGIGGGMKGLAVGAGQRLGLVDQATADAHKRAVAGLNTTPSGAMGSVAGTAIPAAATAIIPGANTYTGSAALGAALGALEPTAADESVVKNMIAGGVGGLAGQGLATALGRTARPVRNQLSPELSTLAQTAEQQFGIPLNAAQKTGSKPLQIIDSVLANLPFTAERQATEKAIQRKAFNRAILNEIGESADLATPEVLGRARTRIGDQFTDLSARNHVDMGNDFLNALAKIDASRTPFSSPKIADAVEKALDLAAKGRISGNEYQKVRTSLTNASKGAWSTDPELGQALKSIRQALDDAATQSVAPADKAAWDTARKQYGNLKTLEKAAAPVSADAVAGNISPAKLAGALIPANKNGMIYGMGDQTMPDLARIGQAFIKEQIPDSATAQRTFWQNLIENPLRAIPATVGGLSMPLQMALHSPAGQRYFMQGAIPATPTNQMLADLLRSGVQGAGAATAIQGAQ